MPPRLPVVWDEGSAFVNANGTLRWNTGLIWNCSHAGPGVYEIEVTPDISTNETKGKAQIISGGSELVCSNVEYTAPSVITVRTVQLVAGVATLTDLPFQFSLELAK